MYIYSSIYKCILYLYVMILFMAEIQLNNCIFRGNETSTKASPLCVAAYA